MIFKTLLIGVWTKNKTRINTGLSFRQYEPIKGEKNKFLFELVVYLIWEFEISHIIPSSRKDVKMNKRDDANYYLGFDVGTNSVGWAVTDENYNLLRKKGKDLWGVRLFNEANTAAKRRAFRSTRRRNMRKSGRLAILRDIFEFEIAKVDRNFYLRLAESKYWADEKKVDGKYTLFHDKDFSDKQYHTLYPTIFHLRKELMETTEKKDIRLYFLAISHILKNRGHFLFEGQDLDNVSEVAPHIEAFAKIMAEDEFAMELSEVFLRELPIRLRDKKTNKNEKKKLLKALVDEEDISADQKKKLKVITDILVSGKGKLSALFDDENLKSDIEKDKDVIDFNSEGYEEKKEEFESLLQERIGIVDTLKSIYDYVKLQDALQGQKSISVSKIQQYEKHKKDLLTLKRVIRKYFGKEIYKNSFTSTTIENNYVHYIGSTEVNKKKHSHATTKKCSCENINKYFYSIIKDLPDEDSDVAYLKKELEERTLLPKPIDSNNSVIPYQVHGYELEAILENLCRDYPDFAVKQDGISAAEKIKLTFVFRIPYYVGPLNDAHKGKENANCWIVRKEGGAIRPWNFSEKVDLQKCEEEFIKRLINKCTYLSDQDVLPKASILYQKFLVLNELNNVVVNGEKLTVEQKQQIYHDLFEKYKRVTQKQLKSYFISQNWADEDVVIGGIDGDFKALLSSWRDLTGILKDDFEENMAEEIIEWITIHTGDKKLLAGKIEKHYPMISEEAKKQIISRKYIDWGRLSKAFLTELIGSDKETGEVGNILHFLYETNDNLMQLLSGRYTFGDAVQAYRKGIESKRFDYHMMDDMYLSPSVKKMIWQVLGIAEEIKKVMGKEPKKIFIEMARSKEEVPERKESRRDNLLKLYKKCKDEMRNWEKEIGDRGEGELRGERLFLYYLQMGKCMYSGDDIDIAALTDKNLYDIDHIIPRWMKKDDSTLNNKVLVKREFNQRVKGAQYPIPTEIRNHKKVYVHWKMLYDKGFITKTKYERLIRTTPLSDEELAGFIDRQLVETRQSTKAAAEILKQRYENSRIIYVKAGLVADFRHDFDMVKVRDLNDLHHAQDAYLNIVVGDGYTTKFTDSPLSFVKASHRNYTLNKIFEKDILRGTKKIWDGKESIKAVKKTVYKNSALVTAGSYEEKGELFQATITRANNIKEGTSYLPLKGEERMQNIRRYGAYVSIKISYFFVVEHTLKKKRVRSIECVPVYLCKEIDGNDEALMRYCTEELGLVEPRVVLRKLKKNSLLEVDGFRYLLKSPTGKNLHLQPVEQLYVNEKQNRQLQKILKALEETIRHEKKDLELLVKDMAEIYQFLKEKMESSVFVERKTFPRELLLMPIEEFVSRDLQSQAEIIRGIMLLSGRNITVDLRSLGGDGQMGKVRITKTITNLKSIVYIAQSKTGLYQERIDLLKK